ncbi:translation initiation factor IF-2 [Acidobacteria bacterium AH-259-O06]|nr:translation initiation factor IF-2 [Acidobacteria bacterium AH-259-O06]
MEQIKVSKLASEFEMKNSLVIMELKKIGVWVPSPDTPVDHDIADRIRRRLQLILDLEQQELEKAKEKKERKKTAATKARKTIKELGKPPKRAKKVEERHPVSPLAKSLMPRKGKASYRKVELPEEEPPQKIEVTIEDEPIIEKVEAQVSAEVLAKAMQKATAAELEAISEKAELEKVKPEAKLVVPVKKEKPEVAAKVKISEAARAPAVEEEPEKKVPEPAPVRIDQVTEEAIKPGVVEEAEKPAPEEVQKEVAKAPEVPVTEIVEPEPAEEEVKEPQEVTFSEKITVKELSEKVRLKSGQIIKELLARGIMATINRTLERKIVEEICEAHGVIPNFVSFEEAAVEQQTIQERPEDLVERAPVVTVMGHVDHGKTSLLDAIRETQVAAGEAGGITQHIGAYHVDVKNRRIIFIDTPGHEAFTRMRARGAQATDVVVLVVAADDGVMPQTLEAIDHARAAEVPILVAINKIDKPEAQPERVKQALSEQNLVPEEWSGDTVMVEVSAKEKTNLDLLLEMILLSADLLELKANPDRSASGVVLEAKLNRGRGAVASVLVKNGTLRIGDSFIAGAAYGKVRAMFNDDGSPLTATEPSSAVEILGLQSLPQAGDPFQVVDDTAKAREIGEYRQDQLREHELAKSSKVSLDDLYTRMEAGDIKELRMVLKADARGSVEVLEDTLEKLGTPKVQVKIIHSGVGAISESDVLLASASNAIVVGFNVRPERNAQDAAEQENVDVRLHTVIYDMSNEVEQAMVGLLEPTFRETDLGRAEVRQTFRVPKFGTIAGSSVLEGVIRRNVEVRLLRDNVVIHESRIDSLHRFKDDINEVKAGYECGISIANFNDIKIGDVIEAYVREEVAPELR